MSANKTHSHEEELNESGIHYCQNELANEHQGPSTNADRNLRGIVPPADGTVTNKDDGSLNPEGIA